MKEDIFENAYFGKAYKTKDNTIVKFVLQDKDFIILYIPKCKYSIETTHRYNSKGEFYLGDGEFGHAALDIVSEWQEPIDEKKLDEMAVKYEYISYGYSVDLEDDIKTDWSNQQNIIDIHEAFKAGYRKALEHKEVPTFNEAAKMWDLCDAYSCLTQNEGWTWEGAVKYIQKYWNDKDFNVDYEKLIEE